MALSEEALTDIREELKVAGQILGYREVSLRSELYGDIADSLGAMIDATDDLLAEHDRLAAEVERLKPLAAIGSGVLAMADYERQGIFYGHRATLSVALYGDDSAVEEWLVNDCHLLFGRGSTAGEALRAAGLLKEKPNGTR